MSSSFPGMDPYLEHPALWPDVHNRLIAAIADAITPFVTPRYYVGLERRTYLLMPDDIVFVGRPDLAVVTTSETVSVATKSTREAMSFEVEVPMSEEVGENYLEIHEVTSGKLVTIVELLSPANKLHSDGRRIYEEKRWQVFRTQTNLVEIDLLRAGEPMPVTGRRVKSDYRILVSHGVLRPKASLLAFNVNQQIPVFPLPLLPGDEEPEVDLGAILAALYDRARFDLRLDYKRPPEPPLREEDALWARARLKKIGLLD